MSGRVQTLRGGLVKNQPLVAIETVPVFCCGPDAEAPETSRTGAWSSGGTGSRECFPPNQSVPFAPFSRKAEMEVKRKQEEEARKKREEEEKRLQVRDPA